MSATPPEAVAIRALIRLGDRLTGVIQVSAAVQHAADAVTELLAPDALLIALADPTTGRLETALAHHYVSPPTDDPVVRLVIQEGPRVLDRAVGAPIRAAGQAVGAIVAGTDAPGRLTETHAAYLAGVAAQLGLALANARLIHLLSSGKREWEQTVDALGQAFCVVDRTGALRRANRAFGELAGVPLTGIAGAPWTTVLPPAWAEAVKHVLAAPADSRPVEMRQGEQTFTMTAYDLGGEEGLAVLVFEDQTERRRLQDQLIQSEKMSAIGQLIAGVAHDLNNPLASVVGFADYLVEEGGAAPPSLRKPLEAIRQEAERAAGIVRNLLTFARKHEGQRRAVSMEPVLTATLQLLHNQLTASKIETKVAVAPDLPAVEMDTNQMQQVFVNLINNAAQAITASGVGDAITVTAEPWLGGVVVTIADNGPGIPEDIADRVFEPFFSTKPEGEGTGLGLSICQGILTEHGGRIVHVAPAAGGASFRVELPGAQVTPDAPAVRPRDPGRLRILVVDDEPHILHYMTATLEAWGHQVTALDTCERALAEARMGGHDVIISDLRMRGLGGREFYERLLADHPALAARVVFSTGDTVRGDVLAFLESAGRPWLRKPFTLAELREALAAAAG